MARSRRPTGLISNESATSAPVADAIAILRTPTFRSPQRSEKRGAPRHIADVARHSSTFFDLFRLSVSVIAFTV